MTWARRMPLFWRVSLTNALVFLVGTLVLALSPATVSTRVLASEAAVLAVGFAVILLLNAALLRSLLVPLDRLTRMMREVEGGNANWLMRILRHEAGHALDSAFRLRRRRRWREVFGPDPED